MNHRQDQSEIDHILEKIDDQMPDSLKAWFEILRIPSIGTDQAYAADCQKTAEWTGKYLTDLGFKTRIMPSSGQPMVVAQYEPKYKRPVPRILFYGHYDVQPADPLELWTTPPFAPEMRKGPDGEDVIYARGAADDKGQFLTFIEAMRATLAVTGDLPFKATVWIEGDEEGDNSIADEFVKKHKDLLAADVAFICDTGLWEDRAPALITSLRGCIAEDVEITGPRIDLHSGYYGGPAQNPIKVLSKILGKMHDAKGRVTIPGFYKGVKVPSSGQRKRLKALNYDADAFLRGAGLTSVTGEKGFSLLEQIWLRPTAEINGIEGGYTGVGSKTVLPSKATAKLSFRLVAGQRPQAVRRAFQKFVRDQLPSDCKVKFLSHGGDSSAVQISSDSIWVKMASEALEAEWGHDTKLVGEGCSIPVVEAFQKYLKVESLLMGFGRETDNIHSPNENYHLSSFTHGIKSWARLFNAIGNMT